METSRALPQPVRTVAAEEAAVPSAWRVRIRMHDHPGTLARIAIRLADLECNILGLSVLPVPGGVLDEIVLRPATGLPRRHLADAIRAEGCECTAIIDADVHELVDPSSSTLLAARRAVDDPARLAEVLKDVLDRGRRHARPRGRGEPGPHRERAPGGVRAGRRGALVARRQWAPFVQLELTRAEALVTLLAAAARNVGGPGGAGPPGRRGDRPAQGRPRRRRGGVRTAPPLLDGDAVPPLPHGSADGPAPLAAPAAGASARHERARGLRPRGDRPGPADPDPKSGGAEISLLVEDDWQRQGIGTALLARVAVLAEAQGITELPRTALTGDEVLPRTAARAGLRTESGIEDGAQLRMFLPA